jgi:uncharacterized membrane protein YgaE (UPF0421/DUF939 family)
LVIVHRRDAKDAEKVFIMKYRSSKNENTTIKIDDKLYDLLRKFCDNEGRRLKDFVEDAIENAIYTEESIKILNEEIKSLKKKEAKYNYAFRRGFQKGFYISFCALHGQILLEPDDEAFEILKNDPYRISKGAQLDLFR